MTFRITFLRENIVFKKKLSRKVRGKAVVRLSWCKEKWVVEPVGARRENETGKEG
jgi:hypothetical protein